MNITHLRYLSTTANLQRTKINPRIVNKVFSCETKKKRKKPNVDAPFVDSTNFTFRENKVLLPSKRATMLNKIFMRSITDLMSTGEVAPKLLGKGLEISRINISPDYKIINVYYFTYKDDEDEIQEILNASAGHMRHELAQLQIMTKSPSIKFVKDKALYLQQKIEHFIANKHLQDKSKQIDNEESDDVSDEYKIELPQMKHNVMGFDHAVVMNKIKTAFKKVQNPETCSEQIVPEVSAENQMTELNVHNYLSTKETNQIFNDFLTKNKIKHQKLFTKKKEKMLNRNEDFKEVDDELYDYGGDMDEYIDEDYYKSIEEEIFWEEENNCEKK